MTKDISVEDFVALHNLEIARASLVLASDEASYVNGVELAVDGGWCAGDYEKALPGGLAR